MAKISEAHAKQLLDYSLFATPPSAPAGHYVNLSLGSPTAATASEFPAGSGVTRQTVTYAEAASPDGSASSLNAMTFGPFSASCVVSGLSIHDAASAGNYLWWGMLASARTMDAGDWLVINAGALVNTMS